MGSQHITLWAAIAIVGSACGSLERKRDAGSDGARAREAGADSNPAKPGLADGAVESANRDTMATATADASADAAPLPTTLVRSSIEPPGSNCPRGGVRILTVLDRNGNHTVDSVDDTMGEQFLCSVYPVSVSLGQRHGCVLASNGTVRCWGADDVGQLGDFGEYAAYAPRLVGGVESARALAVGADFSCVILPTTGVRCWGKNDRGQCGHLTDQPFITPSCVNRRDDAALLGATALALGGAHACAVLEDGTVECWGANDARQLGDGTTQDRNGPVPVLGIAGAQTVVAGGRHTCALLQDTTVRCWGANDEGQLGNGTTTAQAASVTVVEVDGVAPLAGVTALAAGEAFTCALMQDASLRCWGANADCQLGLPATTPRALLPVTSPAGEVQALAAGSQHACALLSSGKAVCWGRNGFGQVGAPAGACRPDPVELPLAHVLSLGAGQTHSCAVDEIGIWCWGDNANGLLGIGVATASRSTPEPQLAIWSSSF